MKKKVLLCPKCFNYENTNWIEIRAEINEYQVSPDPDFGLRYDLEDTIDNEHQLTRHYCNDIKWKNYFEDTSYPAEDFLVEIDFTNKTITPIGRYYQDFPEKLEEAKNKIFS
jgi:hypothetical protein